MWLGCVEEDQADGEIADLYKRAKEQFTFVPDAVKALTVRPEVAIAMDGVKRVLLGDASTIGRRRADLIGTVISGMNHCEYCGTAHSGLLVKNGDMDENTAVALYRNWREVDLDEADRAMLEFAETISFSPAQITEADIARLREVGFTDVNIYDIVLLCAYRNFVNRIHDGLGVTTERLRGRFGDDLVEMINAV